MNYSVQEVVKDVRKALDENEVNTFFIDDVYTLSMDAIIEQKILDATRCITEMAPSRLLDSGVNFASNLYWESGSSGKGMGYTVLPDDFMRLVVFQMSDWKRPVVIPIEDTDPLYFLQKSKFSGIRGGIDKPVCAITTYPTGKVMEFYSCVGGASVGVKVAKYLPYPSIKNGIVDICAHIYMPIVYYTAGMVCQTYKEKEQGQVLFSIAKDFLK
ncbi:hypothetical protein [Bacteroides sp.]|uniref:hypothetical protein n=1 Tax=Bacteroides sp. TaxID=29523 RepID=UPI00261ADCAB|nr:hypothetical protein [Bacteroides sp.]MDD3037149.1 hypothetical protein [Bacteroides sp.]